MGQVLCALLGSYPVLGPSHMLSLVPMAIAAGRPWQPGFQAWLRHLPPDVYLVSG